MLELSDEEVVELASGIKDQFLGDDIQSNTEDEEVRQLRPEDSLFEFPLAEHLGVSSSVPLSLSPIPQKTTVTPHANTVKR